jgi:hypothetical protein
MDNAGEEDTAMRIERLKEEMRELDLEHEREQLELESCSSFTSTISSLDPLVLPVCGDQPAKREYSNGVIPEPILQLDSSASKNSAAARVETEEMKLKTEDAEAPQMAKPADGQADERTKDQFVLSSDERPKDHFDSALSAESSLLRYVVKSNLSSLERHHREVERTIRSNRGMDSLGEKARSRSSRSSITFIEADLRAHAEVDDELRRRAASERSSRSSYTVKSAHPEVDDELRRRASERLAKVAAGRNPHKLAHQRSCHA